MAVFRRTISFFIGILLISASMAVGIDFKAGHYPDFDIRVLSDSHLRVSFDADYGNDFTTLNRSARQVIDGAEYWGRSFIVAVPSDGDVTIDYQYRRAGSIVSDRLKEFAPEYLPLVSKQSEFFARGHKLVRFVILAQRIEGNALAAYDDFIIDLHISGTTSSTGSMPATALDAAIAKSVINPQQLYSFASAMPERPAYKPGLAVFDNADQWVKITIDDNGMYRISAADLQNAGISTANLRSDSLRMFYAGGVLPSANFSDPQPELEQISIRVVDGGDGVFSGTDYLQFYGEASNRYDVTNGTLEYIFNGYTTDNVYWLAVGGFESQAALRWGTVSSSTDTPDETLSFFNDFVRVEQENMLKIDGDGHTRNYYRWYTSDQNNVSTSFTMPQLAAQDSIEIELSALCNFSGTSISLNGSTMIRVGGSGTSYFYILPATAGVAGLNSALLTVQTGINGSYTDYMNVVYPRTLEYTGEALNFNSYEHTGTIQYNVAGNVSGLEILDITDTDHPGLISGASTTGGTISFRRATGDGISRFVAFMADDASAPKSLVLWQGENLYSDVSQYDCIAIAPSGFMNALAEYVSYRAVAGGHRVKLAAVEDIYDMFGFGMESPLAIRRYLKYAYENCAAPAPFAAVFVGDGHYDFRDNLGMHLPSYVPPFIWESDFSAGDDNFVYFGDVGQLDSDSSFVPDADRGWDMMTGRWPVRSSGEVRDYIAKLKAYEAPEDQGIWRSRVTFVADDENKAGYSTEIIHTAQAETLAVFHTPQQMTIDKIYATDYPFASNGDKPTVNSAIVNALNEGSLIVNYIGHGSPDVWADEHIFQKASDLGRLQNNDKLTTVIAGSCSIGNFDTPGNEGMAEMMFRMDGGAISTISATRLVYSRDNAIFSYDLYDAIFGGASNLCEAVYTAKMLHQYYYPGFTNLLRNDRSYVAFGDPLAISGLPEYKVVFDIPGGSQLTPLEYFGFEGQLFDASGDSLVVDGQMTIDVYDSRFVRHHPLGIDYSLGGPQIFRGQVTVTAGRFGGGFVVPLDIDYGGQAAQISGFVNFSTGSALGSVDSLPIAETAGATTDNTGPEVEVSFGDNPEFQTGDRISAEADLIVNLSDVSGINLTGGLGHRIELVIDNDNNTTVNLTDLFSYDEGSYQAGRLTYMLPELTPDRHLFAVKAWDNANNPTIVEFEAVVAQNSDIAIRDVMNYPNPMDEFTEFFFELSESADWAEVQIFTLAGRNIKTLRASNLTAGRNRAFLWDGRDLDGDRVAEGVYLYKITVKGRVIAGSASSDNLTEAFGKLVLLN
ncbi:MAG: type IX secretion system sortase PorU [Candidatus Zixiibacteriota bacterium]